MSNWNPYIPTDDQPWNFLRVWTLHRRAGFGATWQELQSDMADQPDRAIDRVLAGTARLGGVPDNFIDMQQTLGQAAVDSGRPERLAAWWVYLMYFTPDPLRERLAILWHNHFATSNTKVNSLALMREQNEIFRRRGGEDFPSLLTETLKHAAMLKWLDGDENRVGQPNENLGRETLELFTLGVGNYTESDVKEASRALTGWAVTGDEFRERDDWHDPDSKTVLGQTGPFNGDDLIRITVAHPSTARRLAWRLCNEFLAESLASADHIDELEGVLRDDGLQIGPAVEIILRSNLFFSAANLKQRIVGPETFVVGAVRAMEMFAQPASTMVLADWIEQLGRKLFYPSNVGGWQGGRAWLNSRTTIARANFGVALAQGRLNRSDQPLNPLELAEQRIGTRDPEQVIGFFCELLAGTKSEEQTQELLYRSMGNNQNETDRIRNAIALILASPEAQLC